MIDFYIWFTSNARKVAIMLEEVGLAYDTHVVDIGRGDQFKPDFLAISPNNKIPAIVDSDGPDGKTIAVFESGAILVYLAEKSGRYLPEGGAARYDVMQWLMFQMASVGPMFGQYNHFHNYAREQVPYAQDRYSRECARLYQVIERALEGRTYIAGEYSIADVALWPWVSYFEGRGQSPTDFPRVSEWSQRIAQRPAVVRAMDVIGSSPRQGPIDEEHWENMYGDTQYRSR